MPDMMGRLTANSTSAVTRAVGSYNQRVLRSPMTPGIANILMASGTAYWLYAGTLTQDTTYARIRYFVATAAGGTQAAEFAIASSPLPPCGAAQVLTKLGATGSVTDLTATNNQNTPLAITILAGTNVWIGFRSAMGTTQPTFRGLGYDLADGSVLRTAASGALTGAGPWTGSVAAGSTGATTPDFALCMD